MVAELGQDKNMEPRKKTKLTIKYCLMGSRSSNRLRKARVEY